MTIALALPRVVLDDDLRELVLVLEERLDGFQGANATKAAYYELKNALRDMGIALPPMLRTMSAAVGWPATVVDVLEERLDLRGFAEPGGDGLGLAELFADNRLDVESSWAHLDSLIYGVAFVAVSKGDAGEPDPLVTMESPTCTTAIVDPRTRRASSALTIEQDSSGATIAATLYLPDETLWISPGSGRWNIEELDSHGLGRVPIVPMVNRPRAGDMDGHSEITPGVQYLTDAAMRTMAASEVGREFFASPQRWVMGAPESFFMETVTDPKTGETTQRERSAWESYLGRILAIERDEDGQVPTVGQFNSSGLTPYFDQIKALAQMLAAESAIPAHYLGFVTDNPTSADAIRQGEARLVKRVERRQAQFGHCWNDVAALGLLWRDGRLPDDFAAVAPMWRNAATPTRAADADRVTKLIAAKVLRPDSPVTYEELGFTAEQQAQLAREVEAEAELAAASPPPPAPLEVPPENPTGASV